MFLLMQQALRKQGAIPEMGRVWVLNACIDFQIKNSSRELNTESRVLWHLLHRERVWLQKGRIQRPS